MNQIKGAQVKVMDGEERVLVSLLLDLDSNPGVPKWPPSKYKVNNFAFTKHNNRLFPTIIFYIFVAFSQKPGSGSGINSTAVSLEFSNVKIKRKHRCICGKTSLCMPEKQAL